MFRHDLQRTGRSSFRGPETPELKWAYETEYIAHPSPTTGAHGTVYIIHSSPAIGTDGTVYVGSEDFNLYAIHPEGSLKWTYTTGGPVISSPAIGSDGTIYVGSNDYRIYAIFTPEIVRRLRASVVSATTTFGATRVGQPTSLDVTVVLDAPLETTESVQRMILDLAPLGIPSQLPLEHVGEGRYTVSTTVTPLQNGWYSLPILVETAEDTRYLFLEATLEVYPDADLSICGDGPGAGWTIKPSSKADSDPQSSAVTHSGSSAHAITLQRPDEKIPGKITYTFGDPEGVDLSWYTHLSFWIYPGDADIQKLLVDAGGRTRNEEGTKIILKPDLIGDMGLDLSGDRWIEVRIPLEDLCGENERMPFLTLSGTVTGTFYLDDLRLEALKLPEPTAVEASEGMALPSGYALSQNYPNPFNPETTIRYDIAKTGTVRLFIYALTGQLVRTLVDGGRPVGGYSVTWDGTDDAGRDVGSGVYLCRMEIGGYSAVRKLVLAR